MSLTYVDASAAVKLFKLEGESAALRTVVTSLALVSTELLTVEARCTARRVDSGLLPSVERVLATIQFVPLTSTIRDRAGASLRHPLRALDAVHVATALSLREDLESVLVYDSELKRALRAEGLTVTSPGAST